MCLTLCQTFYVRHVILSSPWTWGGGTTIISFRDGGTENLGNLCMVAQPELMEVAFHSPKPQILTIVLLTS